MTVEEKVYFYRLVNASFALNESADRIFAELRNLRALQASVLRQSFWQRIATAGLTLVAVIPALNQLLPNTVPNKIWLYAAGVLVAAYLIFSIVQFIESSGQASIRVPVGTDEADDNPAFLRTQLSQYSMRWQMAQEIIAANPPPDVLGRYQRAKDYWGGRMQAIQPKLRKFVEEEKLTAKEFDDLLKWIPEELRT